MHFESDVPPFQVNLHCDSIDLTNMNQPNLEALEHNIALSTVEYSMDVPNFCEMPVCDTVEATSNERIKTIPVVRVNTDTHECVDNTSL